LVLVSDGSVGLENADGRLEFGWKKIEFMMKENGQQPLQEITERMMSVGRFGPRTDDQNGLVLGILTGSRIVGEKEKPRVRSGRRCLQRFRAAAQSFKPPQSQALR
jgi:hypothetical protein